MSEERQAPTRDWLIVGGVYLALVLIAGVWLAIDRRPPEWDYANHLERVVHCAEDLARRDVRAIIERSSFYPPVVPCAAALVYRLVPSDAAAAQSVILAFLGVGMAAVYLLGRHVAGGREEIDGRPLRQAVQKVSLHSGIWPGVAERIGIILGR